MSMTWDKIIGDSNAVLDDGWIMMEIGTKRDVHEFLQGFSDFGFLQIVES